MDPKLRQRQSSDWLDDLGDFAAVVVAEACEEWRHKPGGRRPTPGDIRSLCVELRERKAFLTRPALPRPMADPDFHERRYREAAEAREQWARERGCDSFKQAMEIGLVAVGRRA